MNTVKFIYSNSENKIHQLVQFKPNKTLVHTEK